MSVRALLGRVQKLEQARMPRPSPFAPFDEFEAQCRQEMAEGRLAKDFPIDCLAHWERTGVWANAQGRR